MNTSSLRGSSFLLLLVGGGGGGGGLTHFVSNSLITMTLRDGRHSWNLSVQYVEDAEAPHEEVHMKRGAYLIQSTIEEMTRMTLQWHLSLMVHSHLMLSQC